MVKGPVRAHVGCFAGCACAFLLTPAAAFKLTRDRSMALVVKLERIEAHSSALGAVRPAGEGRRGLDGRAGKLKDLLEAQAERPQ